MGEFLGFLSYLLLELPARALGLAPDSPVPLIIIAAVLVVAVILIAGRGKRGRRRGRRH